MSIGRCKYDIFDVITVYESQQMRKFSFKSGPRRKKSLSVPSAQLFLPNLDAFDPAGMDMGTVSSIGPAVPSKFGCI
jgi:hypothetical protein